MQLNEKALCSGGILMRATVEELLTLVVTSFEKELFQGVKQVVEHYNFHSFAACMAVCQ